MKQKNSPAVRAMYIVMIPVIAVVLLLNSGILQRLLPAATVNGERYSVVQYNFYYFTYYNEFLETNEKKLADLGYDPDTSASEQIYNETATWEDYLLAQAERLLAETAYYCNLAQQAAYSFSEEDLEPVQEQLSKNSSVMDLYGLSAKNYYISYYGSGMTEELYTEELTKLVKAEAYRSHLLETGIPEEAELSQWLNEHPGRDFLAVDLSVITLEAIPDRGTGEIGQAQLDALSEQLSRLAERYRRGTDFETLQTQFSTCSVGGDSGTLLSSSGAELPEEMQVWCIEHQEDLRVGDTCTAIDAEQGIGYFAVFNGFSGDGRKSEAAQALNSALLDETFEAARAGVYRVERSAIGMRLAAS